MKHAAFILKCKCKDQRYRGVFKNSNLKILFRLCFKQNLLWITGRDRSQNLIPKQNCYHFPTFPNFINLAIEVKFQSPHHPKTEKRNIESVRIVKVCFCTIHNSQGNNPQQNKIGYLPTQFGFPNIPKMSQIFVSESFQNRLNKWINSNQSQCFALWVKNLELSVQ